MSNPKNKKEKKVPLPLKVPVSVFNEIEQEAREDNVSRTEVALFRLQHPPIVLTPALMKELQDGSNNKYEELIKDQPEEAIRLQKEVLELWKYVK
ncbi:MAG: hypothetical protein ACI4EJ_06125 [Bacteroides sp.]